MEADALRDRPSVAETVPDADRNTSPVCGLASVQSRAAIHGMAALPLNVEKASRSRKRMCGHGSEEC